MIAPEGRAEQKGGGHHARGCRREAEASFGSRAGHEGQGAGDDSGVVAEGEGAEGDDDGRYIETAPDGVQPDGVGRRRGLCGH